MKKLLTAVLAASVISTNAAMGASAEEYVTVTFDPNGVEAFEPIKLQIQKGTTLEDRANDFVDSMVFCDEDGNDWCYGDLVIDYYYFDTEGKNRCDLAEHIFDADTTLYAQWLYKIPSIGAVYDPDCAGNTVEDFLKDQVRGFGGGSAEYNYVLSFIREFGSDTALDWSDVLEAGKTYHVILDFEEIDDDHAFGYFTKKYVNGRDVTEDEHYYADSIDIVFTPQKWQLGNVDLKEPEKGVTAKDVMTIIQLANGNKKLSGDAQFMASDINQDYVLSYKDAMLTIREYKKPGSVIK
ncbi:MAG: hypothetical protein IJ129_03030 [Ruminococcus sp.]|nr:hypothetical protein [Ruminococcus sp.]